MSFFKQIEDLAPYLLSINNYEGRYYSIDIKVPANWVIPEEYATDNNVTKFQINNGSNEGSVVGFRFTSEFNENEVEVLLVRVRGFIKFNEERIRKDFLYRKTVELLKDVFEKNSLDKLKKLKFYFDNGKRTDNKRVGESLREVTEGLGEIAQTTGTGEDVVRESTEKDGEGTDD